MENILLFRDKVQLTLVRFIFSGRGLSLGFFFSFCLNHLFYSLCTDDLVVTGLNNRDFYNKNFPSLFILLN